MRMTRFLSAFLGVLLLTSLAHGDGDRPQPAKISPAGEKLAAMLDHMGVDHLWLAGQHINWETGVSTDKPTQGSSKSTHCSAFAAAVAYRLEIYLLRPPEHSQTLLSNAQYEWLENAGKEKGWRRVHSPVEAQSLANEGQLVVATFRSPDPKKPGHIAVVRPSDKSVQEIETAGPQVIQAGQHNHVSTTVEQGFKSHPDAWNAEHHEVRFYAHVVEKSE